MNGEFDLITQFFQQQNQSRADVLLGIGDDCALVVAPNHHSIAITTDTLVAGTHFLADADPKKIGYKALAANLSDLAAMGAKPAWVSLALTLPDVDQSWLKGFCEGFFDLLNKYKLQLIGGDTTKGPLSITITVQGTLPIGEAITRKAACVGDDIYVTGVLGESAAGLDVILHQTENEFSPLSQYLENQHYYSSPRVELAQQIRHLCHAGIDISDGLIADLGHILKQSNKSASIDVNRLPISKQLKEYHQENKNAYQKMALTSGEEYELCFTAKRENREEIKKIAERLEQKIRIIGKITESSSTYLNQCQLYREETLLDWPMLGYDHFRTE